MARLFSRELTEESIQACNDDAAHIERAKLLSGKVILRALDTPDAKDVQISYTFEAGRCTGHVFEDAPAPSPFRNAPFKPVIDGLVRITANYQTFVKLDKGEIEPSDAINSPDYTIDGSMMVLLPLMQAVNSWTEKVRSLEKTYE